MDQGFVDLHSHLLPGVDDGSRTVEQSIQVMEWMARHGTTDVCMTPHLGVNDLGEERLARRLAMFDSASAQLAQHAPALPRLHRGVELMLDAPLDSRMMLDRRISLGGSRFVLVEFWPGTRANAIEGLLAQVLERRFVPLIAHAERYDVAVPTNVDRWKGMGAIIQVDATNLIAKTGARTVRARALVASGLADLLAADNHGDKRTLAAANLFLTQRGGQLQSRFLTVDNPLAIIRDGVPSEVPPFDRFGAPVTVDGDGWLARWRRKH